MKMTANNILMIAYTNYASDPRVIREAEAAVNAGYDVDFLALRNSSGKSSETINGVNLIHLNCSKYRGNSNFRYIISYLMFFYLAFIQTTAGYFKKRYRVVHINNMPDFFVFTALIPKLFGSKIILDIHDPMPATFLTKFGASEGSLKYKILLQQELLSARFADLVITVHEPIKKDVLEAHGIPEGKIKVIANFADESMFPLQNCCIPSERLNMIFHGTISARFGLKRVLETIARLECRDRYFLKIIGEGDYSSELKKIINALDLQDIVDFENRSYPASQLPAIISKYSLGLATYQLSPATDYMLPLKLLEYISTGLPVITVRNSAIKYYFGKGDLFYIDPVSFDPLKKILEECIENPALLEEKRKRILDIRSRYLWANEGKKYVEILNNFCEVSGEKD